MDAEPDRRRGRRAGGSVTAGLARELGYAAALGFDPRGILRADPVERPLLVAALEHAARFERERDEARIEALAKRIVAELAAAMKRGGRKG
jgi:hypothetical protein